MSESDKKHNPSDPSDQNEELELKEVMKTQGPVEAEVVKSFLESNGISVFFRGLVVQSIHAFSADGLGEIRICVPAKDYDLAIKLLEER